MSIKIYSYLLTYSPRIWNKLPASVRLLEDFGHFKWLLKSTFDPLRLRRLITLAFRSRLQSFTYLFITYLFTYSFIQDPRNPFKTKKEKENIANT